jgi:hypothetical protein
MGSGSGQTSFRDALEAQQSYSASSIPSSAWDDPARISIEGYVKSCSDLRSEPELCAIDPHAMEQDSDLAGNSDDSSPASFGFHQSHTPCLQAAPGDRAPEHRIGGRIQRCPNIGITSEMRPGLSVSPD